MPYADILSHPFMHSPHIYLLLPTPSQQQTSAANKRTRHARTHAQHRWIGKKKKGEFTFLKPERRMDGTMHQSTGWMQRMRTCPAFLPYRRHPAPAPGSRFRMRCICMYPKPGLGGKDVNRHSRISSTKSIRDVVLCCMLMIR